MKKAQIWILDVFFALLIFVAVLEIFYHSELNLSDRDEQTFDDIMFESRLVSDSLLSRGYPLSWTVQNVTEIGITDNYRINLTKLDSLRSMNYNTTKSRLRTKYDYYFFFDGPDGILRVDSREGVGKTGINSTNIIAVEKPHNLVTSQRFVIFKSKPAKLVLYLWD